MFIDLVLVSVDKSDLDSQRSGIGGISFLALFYAVLDLISAEPEVNKLKA